MASQMVRVYRVVPRVGTRALATATIKPDSIVERRKEYYPKIGNREIVGSGFNNVPSYMDREDFPFPAIRFKGDSAEALALREKEKGDWKKLTLEEKKALYRNSFCQTYAEMKAPTGEWKSIIAGCLCVVTITAWMFYFIQVQVYQPMPHTINDEWKNASVQRMIKMRTGAVDGISSKFDYEKNEWK